MIKKALKRSIKDSYRNKSWGTMMLLVASYAAISLQGKTDGVSKWIRG